ncbi:hypothetical protein [Micromonospora sp. URMC 103]|uniref:hypothetical protein n=1 Tax=Micromonospora sp. URMC 103 TaxID=3423406 RepID=UPI003F1A5339
MAEPTTSTIIRADQIEPGMTVAAVWPDGQRGRARTVTAVEILPHTGRIKMVTTSRRQPSPYAPGDLFELTETA